MDRREHLKLLLAGGAGAALFMTQACTPEDRQRSEEIIAENGGGPGYGRTEEEKERDERIRSQTFFSEHELATVAVLADIIIPADEESGSATDAGVPDFIEFMMKDYPPFQDPTRGGLMWLDSECNKRFGSRFVNCTKEEQMEMVDLIAWPDDAEPEMMYGVRFFNRMRDLVSTGFFTSEMGVEYMGYEGNRPGFWNGVPQEVLDKHDLSYDEDMMDKYIKEEERYILAEWDEDGNVINRSGNSG